MFEYATKNKLRFPYKGNVSTEDLWDLSVKELDSIYKALSAQIKTTQEPSLLATKSEEDETLAKKIEIVRYIVGVKLAEENARLQAREIKAKRQQIMELIADKKNEALKGSSVEELEAMLNGLE